MYTMPTYAGYDGRIEHNPLEISHIYIYLCLLELALLTSVGLACSCYVFTVFISALRPVFSTCVYAIPANCP